MLPSYFDCIFGHLIQKVRLRPELSPKFFSNLGTNPARTRTRSEKPGPTYNSDVDMHFGRQTNRRGAIDPALTMAMLLPVTIQQAPEYSLQIQNILRNNQF